MDSLDRSKTKSLFRPFGSRVEFNVVVVASVLSRLVPDRGRAENGYRLLLCKENGRTLGIVVVEVVVRDKKKIGIYVKIAFIYRCTAVILRVYLEDLIRKIRINDDLNVTRLYKKASLT